MNGWIEKFTADLRYTTLACLRDMQSIHASIHLTYMCSYRSKIEKEFTENPLIKNLGITIHGSVHEARQREIAERKVSIHQLYHFE